MGQTRFVAMGELGVAFAASLTWSGIPTVFNFWRFVAALNGCLLAVIVVADEAPFVSTSRHSLVLSPAFCTPVQSNFFK